MSKNNTMSPQDRLEVMGLIGRYQHRVDGGDADAYAQSFTPGGLIEWPRGVLRGRAEISKWYESLIPGGVGASPARMRHFLSLPFIFEGTPERCSVRTYMVLFAYNAAGDVIANSHWTYIDTVVKQDGEWLFERRFMQPDLGGLAPRPEK